MGSSCCKKCTEDLVEESSDSDVIICKEDASQTEMKAANYKMVEKNNPAFVHDDNGVV
jgi:hypothetical protein